MLNAVLIENNDNVAVVIEPVKQGEDAAFMLNNRVEEVKATEDIIIYFKVAVRDINMGEKIVKYGENIGEASENIKAGACVHVHNVRSVREDLEGE